MSFRKVLASRTLWLGTVVLAAMLFGGAGSCKAQEVNPAQFTDKGVEDAYPVKKATPKKIVKVQGAGQTASGRTTAQRRKTHHSARKQKAVLNPSL
jgi:hypothetical protein